MKNIRMKIAQVLGYIYGTGILLTLFVGALSFIGYLVAIVIGGAVANDICVFIYKTIYPIIIYASSVSVLLGLIKMYVAGEKALVADKKKRKIVKQETNLALAIPEEPNASIGAEETPSEKDALGTENSNQDEIKGNEN